MPEGFHTHRRWPLLDMSLLELEETHIDQCSSLAHKIVLEPVETRTRHSPLEADKTVQALVETRTRHFPPEADRTVLALEGSRTRHSPLAARKLALACGRKAWLCGRKVSVSLEVRSAAWVWGDRSGVWVCGKKVSSSWADHIPGAWEDRIQWVFCSLLSLLLRRGRISSGSFGRGSVCRQV